MELCRNYVLCLLEKNHKGIFLFESFQSLHLCISQWNINEVPEKNKGTAVYITLQTNAALSPVSSLYFAHFQVVFWCSGNTNTYSPNETLL